MYGLVSIVSLLIRQFCLPNPFACCGDAGVAINWIAGAVLVPICYLIVGLFYRKGSSPAWGSFLFFVTYALFTLVLWLMGLLAFAWWWDVIVVALCVLIIDRKSVV